MKPETGMRLGKGCLVLFCLLCLGWSVAAYFAYQWATHQPVDGVIDYKWSYSSSTQKMAFSKTFETELNGKTLYVEAADTDAKIKQGLSDRESMRDDQGMLFLLGRSDYHSFWMYHMHFPLDIIWMQDRVVVEIVPNMQLPTDTHGIPVSHTPSVKADEVLELTAGGAVRYGLKIGSRVDF